MELIENRRISIYKIHVLNIPNETLKLEIIKLKMIENIGKVINKKKHGA